MFKKKENLVRWRLQLRITRAHKQSFQFWELYDVSRPDPPLRYAVP